MGSGKSSIGKIVAKKTDRFFLDTDSLIETVESKKIRDIFAQNGESYFREIEKNTFDWICESVKNAVISTGGGMPTTVDSMSRGGNVVYLKIDFDTLLDRLRAEEFDKRPLFNDIDFARKLYESRLPIYESAAQITIDATQSMTEIVKSIMENL